VQGRDAGIVFAFAFVVVRSAGGHLTFHVSEYAFRVCRNGLARVETALRGVLRAMPAIAIAIAIAIADDALQRPPLPVLLPLHPLTLLLLHVRASACAKAHR